ncbi:MAG: hypothetical protein KBD01_03920 [Acidobacteria bacterium]|nr:hypothetical protein [Acidobacteriota bacterium]
MKLPLRLLCPLLAGVAACAGSTAPAAAFTPRVRVEIVSRAITLMPPALQRQLRRHPRELNEAALAGGAAEGQGEHALLPGTADAALQAAIADATRLIDARAPMKDVARAFGRIAHAAADLSFALNIGPPDPRAARVYASFSRYTEQMLPKMALTFGLYADPDLARGDVAAFARRTAADARRDYDAILRSYFPRDREPNAQDFDERSIAFAAASLEVSLAMTTTAKAWMFAWYRAHGDMTGTPTLEVPPPPTASPQEEQP